MAYNQGDPNYKTKNSTIRNYKDFSDEIKREKEDLEKTKRNFDKNELGIYNVANKFKKRYNKVTKKLDDVTKDEIVDDIEAIDLDEIKESITYKKILESVIQYTDKFRSLIHKVKSPISKDILSIEKKDIEGTRSNYFGITDKNDTVNFIPDKKFQDITNKDSYVLIDANRVLSRSDKSKNVFDKLGIDITKEATPIQGIIGIVKKTYLSTVSKKTWAAFVDKKGSEYVVNMKGLKPAAEVEMEKSKQEIKIGRGIKALLLSANINKTDKEIEDFVNLYKSQWDIENDAFRFFEVVKGEKIRKFYSEESYDDPEDGSLGQSCMKHDECQDYLDIYTENPDKIELVILHPPKGDKSAIEKGSISGRALLWKLDNGKVFMDRVYTTNDSDVLLFKEYAKKNGWYCKHSQQQGNTGFEAPDKQSESLKKLVVTLKKVTFNNYPYVDTLKYLDIETKQISNNEDVVSKKGAAWELESTDGGKDCMRCNGNETECPKCKGIGNIKCTKCKGSHEEDCKECKGTGEITCPDCKRKKNKDDCPTCNGTTKTECDDCNGTGDQDCEDCGGSGEIECPDCGGYGHVDCKYCN